MRASRHRHIRQLATVECDPILWPRVSVTAFFVLFSFSLLSPHASSASQPEIQEPHESHAVGLVCTPDTHEINLGQPVTIKCTLDGASPIYSFGSSAGKLSITGDTATLNTSGLPTSLKSITIICSAVNPSGTTEQAMIVVGVSTPQVPKPLPEVFNGFAVVAPTLSWTTGTQTQTIAGGSTILSAVRSASYCDEKMYQFGVAANASDTATTKLGASTVNLDNNEVKFDGTSGILGHQDPNDPTKTDTNSYLGVDADFFGNNSLGIGLQQTYAAEYQYYLRKCTASRDVGNHRVFASVGAGVGFMNQRLYDTQATLSSAVLPLSAQFSYLLGEDPGKPPKLIFYGLLGYLPVLTDMHAYQVSAIAGLQIPTRYPWLTFTLTESDLYMDNAPTGFKRNYQNGSVAIVFTFPANPAKVSNPAIPDNDKGACYGGDKLARLYCFDEVTIDACIAPNMFRRAQHCSSSGVTPAFTAQ